MHATAPSVRTRPVLPARPGPPRRWWADLVGVVALGTLAVVLALWLHGGGVQRLGTAPATAAGQLTGLLAADLLLVQVFLMARVPWVERSYGQDRLTRWHRAAGFASFWLMLAHVTLIVVGYAASDASGPLREAWTLTTRYPGMLLAVAGTALLVAVVALSIRAARRHLRYESWHLLHLYAYLGVGLALPHQLWTGTDFVSHPLARAYWWTAYLVAAGAVVAFRIVLPLVRSLRHDLRVAAVRAEAPGVVRGTTPAPGTSAATPARPGGTVTINGTVVDNGYGPIRVQVRIAGGRIVDVVTLATPGDGHSRRINSVAVPQLRQEALTAQSAHIDTVSGATATSDAYRGSLQAALDAAHFGPGS